MSVFDRVREAGRAAAKAAVEAANRAAEAAMQRPEVRERVGQARARVDDVKKRVEAQLEHVEADLWAWINKLQAEAEKVNRQQIRRRSSTDYYAVLGLRPGADLPTVKKAFRDQMRAHHPDRFAHDPVAEQRAHEQAQRINEAYRELTALLTGRESRRSN